MKKLILFASSALLLCLVGFAQSENLVPPPFTDAYPQMGMSITDLATAMAEITPILPTTPGPSDNSDYKPNVLRVKVYGTSRIVLTTGLQRGPRSGSGHEFEFRKLNGKWTKVAEADWVS
jgi:hypothetical protein